MNVIRCMICGREEEDTEYTESLATTGYLRMSGLEWYCLKNGWHQTIYYDHEDKSWKDRWLCPDCVKKQTEEDR